MNSPKRTWRPLSGFLVGVALAIVAGAWLVYDSARSDYEIQPELMSSEYDPVQEFVSEYYEAAGGLVWGTTYSLLDDEAKSRITEDDWEFAQKARYFEDDATSPPLSAEVVDSETSGESIVADLLVTYEDGSREEIAGFAMSINPADGSVERSLTDEDIGYLMGLVNEHRGNNEFEVYRDCPEDPADNTQYGANCGIVIEVSSPVFEDVADDAMRDTTTSTGAINQSEPEMTSESIGDTADIVEDARRDSTTATGAINSSELPEETVRSDPVIVDTIEDAMNDSATAADALASAPTDEESSTEVTPVEETLVEGTSGGEVASGGRVELLGAVGGGAAIARGVLLVGGFFLLRR